MKKTFMNVICMGIETFSILTVLFFFFFFAIKGGWNWKDVFFKVSSSVPAHGANPGMPGDVNVHESQEFQC